MVELPENLARALEKSIDAIKDDTHVDMYLLKQTQSKKPEKRFELQTMDIIDDIPKKFREIAKKKLAAADVAIKNKTRPVKVFYDMNYKKKNITFIAPTKVPFFEHIKTAMKEHTNLHVLEDLSEVKKFHSIALRFCTSDGDVIYFRKIRSYQLVSRHYSITGALHKGKFNKVKDDILAFDEVVDCVYFEEADSILVLDKSMTESIFAFKDYYIEGTKNAIGTLTSLKLVEVDATLFDKVLRSKSYTRQITEMLQDGKFKRDTKWFADHLTLFQSEPAKYKAQLASYAIGTDGQVVIKNEVQLDTFLGVCSDSYVRSRVSSKDFFAPVKEELS